ncbi:hypothetical protein SAMD00023353_0900070 [Rosellinia necatrix]|uniref:Uncharacterized protein n=1 Tax=Rosellinia necatrix TaxID=77044 RepID=A0A1W2THE4_ROSNE|nr:hypothetical protein SAMD00023353_0900070 [Rosellinia necatrix]
MADVDAQLDGPHELAVKSAEEELIRRRERGRLSQARFRQRQAQASRETQAENERLRATIAEIVTAARRRDGNSLLAAIRAAADVAGVDASDLMGRDRQENKPVAAEPKSDERSGSDERPGSDGGGVPIKPGVHTRSDTSPRRPQWLENEHEYSPDSLAMRAPPPQPSGRVSPRLDYGIWVGSGLRVTKPPVEIVPFLGAGRYTFAGQVYWACADYTISLCRLVTSPHAPPSPWFDHHSHSHSRPTTTSPPPRLTPREAEDRIWAVLRHSPPLRNVRLAQALAEAQRAFLDTGALGGDSPAACDAEIGPRLRRAVEADYRARGADPGAWMTLAELDAHVRRRRGRAAFARLEAAIAVAVAGRDGVVTGVGMGMGPHPDPDPDPETGLSDPREIVRLLIRNLAESYICFGDGPRWRADCVTTLFSETMVM